MAELGLDPGPLGLGSSLQGHQDSTWGQGVGGLRGEGKPGSRLGASGTRCCHTYPPLRAPVSSKGEVPPASLLQRRGGQGPPDTAPGCFSLELTFFLDSRVGKLQAGRANQVHLKCQPLPSSRDAWESVEKDSEAQWGPRQSFLALRKD